MLTSTQQHDMIKQVEIEVNKYMAPYDASHDQHHIERVVKLAHRLLRAQRQEHPGIDYDEFLITLAAMIHDVGDHKYPKPNQTNEERKVAGEKLLLSCGVDPSLAHVAQVIASGVSYTAECRDPEAVRQLIEQYPELAIVQDADRLDALGAIGISRIFTYNGAHPRPGGTMQSALAHNIAKLKRLPGMMKTGEGRRLAEVRWPRVQNFIDMWEEEADLDGDGSGRIDWEGCVYDS